MVKYNKELYNVIYKILSDSINKSDICHRPPWIGISPYRINGEAYYRCNVWVCIGRDEDITIYPTDNKYFIVEISDPESLGKLFKVVIEDYFLKFYESEDDNPIFVPNLESYHDQIHSVIPWCQEMETYPYNLT